MPQRILVTGATGLLGNCIVRELLARGLAVRVLARAGKDAAERPELAGLKVEVVTGQLNDLDILDQAVAGCDAVIHSAASIHIGYHRRAESQRTNVDGSRAVAQICQRYGVKLVYVSTVDTLPAAVAADQPLDETAVDRGAGCPKTACTYVLTKQAAEQEIIAAERRGLDVVIVHPGFMLGPYDWKPSSGALILAVKKAPVVVSPRGTASVSDARDVAAAIVNSLTLGESGQHYILAGENLPYPQLCSQIIQVIGQSKRVFRMGPVIPAAACMADFWYRLSGAEERLFNGAAIAMGGLHHAYSSAKAERQLEYVRRPIDQTLRDAWTWIAAHHL